MLARFWPHLKLISIYYYFRRRWRQDVNLLPLKLAIFFFNKEELVAVLWPPSFKTKERRGGDRQKIKDIRHTHWKPLQPIDWIGLGASSVITDVNPQGLLINWIDSAAAWIKLDREARWWQTLSLVTPPLCTVGWLSRAEIYVLEVEPSLVPIVASLPVSWLTFLASFLN